MSKHKISTNVFWKKKKDKKICKKLIQTKIQTIDKQKLKEYGKNYCNTRKNSSM